MGHTDDAADHPYNQALSEKRSQAVHDRLAQVADLSAWLNDPATVLDSTRGEGGAPEVIGFSDGLTLLAGGRRVFPVDHLDAGAGLHMPLTELSTFKALKEDHHDLRGLARYW